MTIITAAEIQKGDLIKVTTVDVDRTNSFQGIADHCKRDSHSLKQRWFTADDWTLWTSAEGAVIELLDRPKPKITVPTGNGAVVKYVGHNSLGNPLNRTAIRDEHGVWKSYDDAGNCTLTSDSDDHFADRMSNKEDFTVIFGGVAK